MEQLLTFLMLADEHVGLVEFEVLEATCLALEVKIGLQLDVLVDEIHIFHAIILALECVCRQLRFVAVDLITLLRHDLLEVLLASSVRSDLLLRLLELRLQVLDLVLQIAADTG